MTPARILLLFVVPLVLAAQPFAGRRPNGSAILPNGWPITPAGAQVELSTLPISIELHPDGIHAFVLNSGFLAPTISLVDLDAGSVISETPAPGAWLGLELDSKGERLYVSGGSRGTVLVYGYADGVLTPLAEHSVIEGTLDDHDFIGDVRLSRDERFLFAANLFDDSVSVTNLSSGLRVRTFTTGARPYRLALGQRGETLWVSHWGGSSIGLYSLPDGRVLERVSSGSLPTDMVLLEGSVETHEDEGLPITARLFVACANTNDVWVYGLTAGDRVRQLERISVGPSDAAPAGTAPTAVSLSPDGQRLYITASGNNVVVLADVSAARTTLVGAIPTGWYPTATQERDNGGLVYLNGKGGGSMPAPHGPNPTDRGSEQQYVAAMQRGSLGILPQLEPAQLAALTQRASENILYDDELLEDAGVPDSNPIPTRPGETSPIQHVVLVVKENRTFDQILGDSDLVVFGETVAPNHRRLAEQFVLLDNFYAAGDTSADGQNWTTAAIANDFIEKLWPATLGRRLNLRPFEGGDTASFPPAGYIWSNAQSAGLTVRNYGLFEGTIDTGLAALSAPGYPGFDLTIPDGKRVDLFLADWARLEQAGTLASLSLVYLPNDHTAGRAPGHPTAQAMMAEHDYALGRLIEGVSNSASWASTAVFVVEDDAQDGADHVDSHRSIAFIASPYSSRSSHDSTFYSTPSVLRTIGLILGLRPMTQFDAAALPMWRSFTAEPTVEPYQAIRPEQDFDQLNPQGSGAFPRRVQIDLKPLADSHLEAF
jgi:DNA-binding beta-propeller fold protein YncE